jgi:hypothetical protein
MELRMFKKLSIGCLGLVLVVIVLGALASAGSKGSTATTSTGAPAASAPASAAATATPEPPKAAKVGETLQTNNWKLAVSSVDRPGKSLVWSEFGNKQDAVGTWLVVNLALTNIGKSNFTVNAHDFELKDKGGVTYTTANCCFSYPSFKKILPMGQQMPPTVEGKSALIFDVAPTAEGLTLTFKQDGGRTWAIE